MKSYRKPAVRRLIALLALIVLMQLNACAMIKRHKPSTQPPQVSCEERAPAEEPYPLPSGSDDPVTLRKALLAWVGIATAEVQKRATTAQCLDTLRDQGVIR